MLARGQLIALGFSRHAIDGMISKGRIGVVHRGVYAIGPARLTREGRWLAAVLAAGPGAVLSHRSAAASWQLLPPSGGDVEVTIPRRGHPRAGIAIHCSQLAADEISTVDKIPVTSVARTLFDLAAAVSLSRLERAMNEAEVRRLWDATGLQQLIDRHPRHRGTRALRAVLAGHDLGRTVTRSEFEACFLGFLAENGFPRPHVNRLVPTASRPHECDAVWPEARLIVELDGYEAHGTRRGFEQDRARDRALAIAGWRVVRITWRQLRDEPRTLAADLRALLGSHPIAGAA